MTLDSDARDKHPPSSHRWPFRLLNYSPEMLAELSLPTARTDPTLIRFDPISGNLAAATPEMIVIHLTSQDTLDYDLLSDFFLTFRMFMNPHRLLELLVGRLAWAITTQATTQSELGRDVSVRTFVMLRHWILNFFPDDFVLSYDLRVAFSNYFTALYSWDLVQSYPSSLLIMNQLKKCWLRSCSLYWDLDTPSDQTFRQRRSRTGVSPGGNLGSTATASQPATRRTTVLSLYQVPIKPVLSNPPESLAQEDIVSMMGSLIKGGISLSTDAHVKDIHPPTPIKSMSPANARLLDRDGKKAKTVRGMVDNWRREFGHHKDKALRRFFSKVIHVDHTHRKTESGSTGLSFSSGESEQGRVRIDILSARVIEELDTILKHQDLQGVLSPQSSSGCSHASAESLPVRSPAPDTVTNDTSFMSTSTKKDQDIHRHTHTLSLDKVFAKSLDKVQAGQLSLPVKPASPSAASGLLQVFDSGVQNFSRRSSLTSPMSHSFSRRSVSSGPPISRPTSHRFSLIDSLDMRSHMRHPSFDESWVSDSDSELSVMGPHPDTLSFQSLKSFDEYDDQYSMFDDTSHVGEATTGATTMGGLRRVRNVYDFRAVSPTHASTSSSIFSAGGAVRVSITAPSHSPPNLKPRPLHVQLPNMTRSSTSLTKENFFNNALETPETGAHNGTGVVPDMVAELAKIPDPLPEDDEVGAALRKLEGTYETDEGRFSDAASVATDNVDGDSSLYRGAFETPTKKKKPRPPPLNLDGSPDPTPSGDLATQTPVVAIRSPHDPLSVASTVPYGNHTPFILNFSSKSLSEQLTLIERDALNEIDWKELIELQWDQKVEPVQSWLGYLASRGRVGGHGVEVVISRFNLMVNWVKSEILLTRARKERVQTIARFIHVAHHARRLQNYATMLQIVLALSSAHVRRLRKTWSAVASHDAEILEQLEQLVSPFRNFQRLRAEVGSLDTSLGCIPFVGVYLSDLVYNAERPATVSASTGPQQNVDAQRNRSIGSGSGSGSVNQSKANKTLVNFDRFRTSANIVKSLIQCIEWARNYKLQGDADLLAKCLYVQSLTESEMEDCYEYLDE